MRPRPLLWHIVPGFLLVTLASLAGVAYFGTRAFTQFHDRQREEDLAALALVAAHEIADRTAARIAAGDLQDLCLGLGHDAGARVTVVDPGGRVLCDTERDPATLENHGGRPEVAGAIAGRTSSSRRFSSTLEEELLYVAAPFSYGGARGAVRFALPARRLHETVAGMRARFFLSALGALGLVVLVSLLLVRRITGPLRELAAGAERFARGEFATRVPALPVGELGVVADEMNRMAGDLDARIRGEVRQRRELEAVLASMSEGVIAFDRDATVLSLNRAAAGLLGVRPEGARGRSIEETVRNPELQAFVTRTLAAEGTTSGELAYLDASGERFLQAHGTALEDAGRRMGALVVLTDVTGLRRLERMRRDFVANASHEIRTPVTSIKGFIETREDGAIEDPAAARRFLAIMHKNADRLHSLIDDLLNLSRIEQEAERGEIAREPTALAGVVREALDACGQQIAARGVRAEAGCLGGLEARVNGPLLLQALVNLVDNAVKYSGPGSLVRVECGRADDGVFLRVADTGPGIPREHLPRLFERFYRVDKARSRDLGGTGLGLAIVKHIVHAHRGEITVESEPGRGTTFTITLPA